MDIHDDRPLILIVDERTPVIETLAAHLQQDYRTMGATNGPTALALCRSEKRPYLMLVQVDMDELDGFQVCQKLKKDDQISSIEVVFIAETRNSADDEIRAFALGGADFLRAPVKAEVLRHRVGTHIQLKKARERLAVYATEMNVLVQEKARKLVQAESVAILGKLAMGVAHELRGPIMYMLLHMDVLRSQIDDVSPFMMFDLSDRDEKRKRFRGFLNESRQTLLSLEHGAEQLNSIFDSMRLFFNDVGIRHDPCQVETCIRNALRMCHNVLKQNVDVHTDIAHDMPMVMANAKLLEQVFINLFNNAADAIAATGRHGNLEIAARLESGKIRITVADSGPGIPAKQLEHIWEAFFSTKTHNHGTGLGLTISRGVIQHLKGKIWAENRVDGGARITIKLPALVDKDTGKADGKHG